MMPFDSSIGNNNNNNNNKTTTPIAVQLNLTLVNVVNGGVVFFKRSMINSREVGE